MAIWLIFLGIAILCLGGAGFLTWRGTRQESMRDVQMPAFSVLGNSAKEYNAKEVHLPVPREPVKIRRANQDEYQELPLPMEDAPKNQHLDENISASGQQTEEEKKKKGQDWTPMAFFGDENR